MGQILSSIWKEESHETIWLNHYNNQQRILLVGEGDFSFSASLANAFGSSASKIIATSLDSIEFLRRNYRNSIANIRTLERSGARVIHSVNATTMSNHPSLRFIRFDRIIFNFPHSGFNNEEHRDKALQRHRELVRNFLSNAKRMIKMDGEIHISHKTNGFHRHWNVNQLALDEGLSLVRQVNFNLNDYPGYQTKYGFGSDRNFECNPSDTYMWRIPTELH